MFKHKGKFYFAIYHDDKSVRLRSEGFKNASRRDQELSAVLKLKDDKGQYETIESNGKYVHVLKNKSGDEVARSCLSSSALPFTAVAGSGGVSKTVAATGASVAASSLASEKSSAKEVLPPVEKKVVTRTAAAGSAAAKPAAVSGGGFKWWWLLPLLLLIPLFFGWKTCNNQANVVPAVKTTSTADKAKKDKLAAEKAAEAKRLEAERIAAAKKAEEERKTAEVAEKKVEEKKVATEKKDTKEEAKKKDVLPVAAKSCDCSAQKHRVFKVPSGPAPKTLTKLGLFPEFGDSHALDPAGFYSKLKKRYDSVSVDRQFLDGIFKAMGYKGFSDAKPSMFSNTTIKSGITANIGGGPNHKTYHRKLALSGKDLKAFKIKAANGCELHFMKTCGNHMFYCPN